VTIGKQVRKSLQVYRQARINQVALDIEPSLMEKMLLRHMQGYNVGTESQQEKYQN
jgi:ribosomal protein L21E